MLAVINILFTFEYRNKQKHEKMKFRKDIKMGQKFRLKSMVGEEEFLIVRAETKTTFLKDQRESNFYVRILSFIPKLKAFENSREIGKEYLYSVSQIRQAELL